MSSRRYFALVAAVSIGIGILLAAQPLSAQFFSIPVDGFTTTNTCPNSKSPAAACQVLTNGFPTLPQVTSSGTLRLTSANLNRHGTAWFRTQQALSPGFTISFQYQISNTGLCSGCAFPADGLALVIQNDPAGTGAIGYVLNGENISYGNDDISIAKIPGLAILNSLAIELDTHQNTDYGDPDGNHIAIQSCGPNNSNTLSPNSADHNYICASGSPAKLALASLPAGMSLSDQAIHTITVNYLPPGNCNSNCNNLSVFFDSTLIVQATVNIATQLNLTGGTSAYVGFTAATGSLAQNNDIVSWSMSQWPLAPITIVQPVQTTTTNFNYTTNLNATVDYSQSGLGANTFQGLFMQGTAQAITDDAFTALVTNTPFQGTSCQHVDTGTGNFVCAVITDLCTTSSSSTPAGANCASTGQNPLIGLISNYDIDPAQRPIVAPGYIMGKDNALSCGAAGDNSCKGLVSVFTSITGDPVTTKGKTDNFNSSLFLILGALQPSTTVTTTPPLNQGWASGPLTVNFSSIETVPANNTHPLSPQPTIASINYSATGANVPAPASGTINGGSGSVNLPVNAEGQTVFTYSAVDSANTPETVITNTGDVVSSASPTFTINVDLTPPTLNCTPPAVAWSANDVSVPCTASDNAGGSGLVGPASFSVQTNVAAGTETNAATTVPPFVTVMDVAGNTSLPQPAQGSFGPFEVDKKMPVITGPTISPASPVFGQTVTAYWSCSDGGSGVTQCGPSGSPSFPAGTASTGPLQTNVDGSIGPHMFTVLAQDAVGNQSAPSVVNYAVGQATPTITWPPPAAITYGTALSGTQLDATASVAGNFAYNPAAGTVLSAGMQTLNVTFTPTDATDYKTVYGSVQLMVNKATPTLTWPTPAPILLGTPLSATQLDATASVPGTFLYNPPAGTVLAAGNQVLNVSFTPTDTNDYNSTGAQVNLLVTQPLISFSPSSINFGSVRLGNSSTITVNVSNPGTAPLKISSIAIAGNNEDNDLFTITNNCTSAVAPGGGCSFKVKFTASEVETFNFTILVTDNVAGSPQQLPLTATGTRH